MLAATTAIVTLFGGRDCACDDMPNGFK